MHLNMNLSPNSNKESPKTPGGISKSLLTPCRRVGLSRKWRKGSCSPFISPLCNQTTTPERSEIRVEKKRKKCEENKHIEVNSETSNEQLNSVNRSISPTSCKQLNTNEDIVSTPCRNSQISRKKYKVLSLKNSIETEKEELPSEKQLPTSNDAFITDEFKIKQINLYKDKMECAQSYEGLKNKQMMEVDAKNLSPKEKVSKLTRTKSKSKKLSLKKSLSKNECTAIEPKLKESAGFSKSKEKSPNNLTKECIVVIQNKILKAYPNINNDKTESVLHESDSEPDIPLNILKQESINNITLDTLNDNDFINKPIKTKVRNLSLYRNRTNLHATESSNNSQSSQEDIDKRTILVKKTYEKVIRPEKSKSTGSITQKDIDDLKARIEMKKKLLQAKAMSNDTEELRCLIKKWQKGCQDALMELIDLMKKKLPDKQNMDYSEILESLKIPAELVGYDAENDCYITPNDTSIILSTFKL